MSKVKGPGGEARLLLTILLFALCLPAHAQSPRIAALFPAGAKAGETVEVAVKGGGLAGAQKVLVLGAPGVTAELVPSSVGTIDETARPVFQNKCTSCHEPRSPANRSMSPDQWASTVDRMITARGAEINKPDRDKIVGYLQGMAKAGQVSAKVTVAPNAAPGLRELRVITSGGGASSAWTFEVGATPEVATTTTAPGTNPQSAPKLALPVVVNGLMAASGQKDYFSFVVKKNERVYFDLKANRLNAQSQANFSPLLVLYDAQGNEIAKNLGRFGIDPALAFTPTEEGTVTLLVRDLLWKGSPASVYRLSAGTAPFSDGMVVFPPVAQPGQTLTAHLIEVGATSGDGVPASLSVPASGANGITTVAAPNAQTRLLVRNAPGGPPNGANGSPLRLPGAFWGKLTQAEQIDVFTVQAEKPGGLELYARRLGSPLTAQVVVKNSAGNVVAQRIADSDEDDLSLPNAFSSPGTYRVEISDVNGSVGPSCVYAWESVDKAPQFSLSVSPDVVAIAPGGATALVVRAPKRDNLSGPISLRLSGLPPGVTVSPAQAVLPPDADQAIFVLQAAPTAAVASQPIVIEGTVVGGDATLTHRAETTEIFRVNNVLHTTPRKSQMVSVMADAPPFTLALVGNADRVALAPGEEVKLQVVVNRSTSKGDVALSILGLPPGVTTQNVLTVPAKESTATFTLRASRDAKTLGPNRPLPNLPPVQITVVGYPATGGGNNADFAPTAATPPILLVGK